MNPPEAGIDQGRQNIAKGGLRSFEAATGDGRSAQNSGHSIFAFVVVGAAGEIDSVSHTFHPDGRLRASNSP